MPDLRRDPIVGRWVIISTERSGRPHDFITLNRLAQVPHLSARFVQDKSA